MSFFSREEKIKNYISQSINEFGISVLNAITGENDTNKVISPLFLSSAFGMLQLVSQGRVINDKIREFFDYTKHDIADSEVHDAYNNLLEPIRGENSSKYVLNLANGVMVQNAQHFKVLENYSNQLQINYDASIQFLDFANDGQKAINTINKWVEDKTSGKIDRIFIERLPEDTKLVIVNAVCFRGNLLKKFNPKTTGLVTFFNNGVTLPPFPTVNIMQMYRTEYNITRRDIDYQLDADIVELPYNDCDISMYIVLPHTVNGLQKTVSLLTEQKLNYAIKSMASEIINLYLPKFNIKVRYTLALENIFAKNANLSGINSCQHLNVSEMVHRVFLEFNENGCEDNALSDIKIELNRHNTQTTRQFIVDHPFIFVIRDKRNDVILFYGQINEIK